MNGRDRRRHFQCAGGGLKFGHEIGTAARRGLGVDHGCGSRDAGRDLCQQLQPSSGDRWLLDHEASDISAGTRQARHKTIAHRISDSRKNDRNCLRFPLDRSGRRRRNG